MVSLTGARERAQPRRCNRSFSCASFLYVCMWTCFVNSVTLRTFFATSEYCCFLVPLIRAHAHTHTHAQWQLVENIVGAARAV